MASQKYIKVANGNIWVLGAYDLFPLRIHGHNGETINIPIDQLLGMSAEQIGQTVLGLVTDAIQFRAEYDEFQQAQQEKLQTRRSKPQAQDTHGYVYMIHAVGTNLYKIGKARSVEARFKAISTGCPYECKLIGQIESPDYGGTEFFWHENFSEQRRTGEWFELTRNDVAEFLEYAQ